MPKIKLSKLITSLEHLIKELLIIGINIASTLEILIFIWIKLFNFRKVSIFWKKFIMDIANKEKSIAVKFISSIGLPIGILILMTMMVIPLPAFLLDVFFTSNILIS